MNLTLQRLFRNDNVTIGSLSIDGINDCATLEPALSIPIGHFEVKLTLSNRARTGHLWTPDAYYRLLELQDVQGHEAIRIHAGNSYYDTEGCILVGEKAGEDRLVNSRATLTSLMQRVTFPLTIEIKDIQTHVEQD